MGAMFRTQMIMTLKCDHKGHDDTDEEFLTKEYIGENTEDCENQAHDDGWTSYIKPDIFDRLKTHYSCPMCSGNWKR